VDIVEVIGSYIELKKAGSNYKALCPFHAEKTPSFVVSPSKQVYHCFGCHAKGNALTFVMEYEKLTYPEAIEKLAAMYNFKLEYVKGDFIKMDLLESVNSFYVSNLYKNQTAYEYLKQRGLYDSTIEKFSLGYAPDIKTQMQHFKNANLNLKELSELGVLVNEEYPRLIERITFPIFSQSGKIIAFGGRTITNHPAKYINFSNTKIFNKSKTFYGLNFAREHILRKKEAVIVEGYMDVIMLHQAGVENTIATLGTALTPSHLPILKRLDSKVIMAYDGDSAGIASALKAAKLLYSHFFEGGVAIFSDGKDPADIIKSGEDISAYLKPIPFKEFILQESIKNASTPQEKKKVHDEIKAYIKSLDPILQEDFLLTAQKYLNITHKTSQNIISGENKKIDLAEGSIIKTLYENPQWIDEMVEYLDPNMFTHHPDVLRMIYTEDFDNPQVLDIVLRDDIVVLDKETLKKQIIKILIPYYRQKLNEVKYSQLDKDTKAHIIKNINQKLKTLKEGKLIESDITI